jgi:F-type H+-transporting ATPase subunit b
MNDTLRKNTLSIAIAITLLLAAAPALAAGGGGYGFPWATWGVSIFNLVVFLGIIVYFGGGKIQDHFQNRRESLVENLDAAKRLREEAEQKLAEYQGRLDSLEDERKELLDQYHEQGEAEKARLVEEAKASVEKMRRDAELIIQAETRRAIATLEKQAVDLAIGMASDKLKDAIDDGIDGQLVDRYVSDVRKIEAA